MYSDHILKVLADHEAIMPCSLTPEDIEAPTGEEVLPRFYFSSNPPCTDEPERWVEAIFEPDDIIEIRLTAPRSMQARMQPKRFYGRMTANAHRLQVFPRARDVRGVVDTLNQLNQGSKTFWGNGDGKDQANAVQESGIQINIFIGVNPRRDVGGKTSDDVVCARCLVADLDKCTIEEGLGRLADTNLPRPTMIVNSGHGVHFYWRLTKPLSDLAEWTSLQKQLILALGSDPAIHDPARVMRVPGFQNVNGETPVPCSIVEVDTARKYDPADLQDLLAASTPHPAPDIRIPDLGNGAATTPTQGLTEPFEHHAVAGVNGMTVLDEALRRATAFVKAALPPVEGQRNNTYFRMACSIVELFGQGADEIFTLLARHNDALTNPLDHGELQGLIRNAIRYVAKRKRCSQPGLTSEVPIEAYVEPAEEIISLPEWRDQMERHRIGSLGQVGCTFFDGSTTGAGKSTADLKAMKQASSSLTVVPTHDAAKDVVDNLKASGLPAAAHPEMNESSCQQFGTESNPGVARMALEAGLNVGQSICPGCSHSTTCDWQKQREKARSSAHAVATHRRAELSDFTPAKDKEIVFVHEDALSMLRPAVTLKEKAVRQLEDLQRVVEVATEMANQWNDDHARHFVKLLRAAIEELHEILTSPNVIAPAGSGVLPPSLPAVKPIPKRQPVNRYQSADKLLHKAMSKANIYPAGDVVRLVISHACGELETICLTVHQGDDSTLHRSVVGVWKTKLPPGTVMWFEDASSNATLLTKLVGTTVIDATPAGRLELVKPPVQYVSYLKEDNQPAALDITQGTTEGRFRSILRGLLASYPKACRVGIITHKCHTETVDSLPPIWRRRILRVDYFRSGTDRASNDWLACDLILILGTPRLPPMGIQEALIQLGEIAEAAQDGDFGDLLWEGKTTDGSITTVLGLGYRNPSWAEMHRYKVKEALKQAVGRGRGVTDRAVDVVVVSSESIGSLLSPDPLRLVDDSEDQTLQIALARTATDPAQPNGVFKTKELAQGSAVGEREIRKHLRNLVASGLIQKKGARSGYRVANWLSELASKPVDGEQASQPPEEQSSPETHQKND